ncbi:Pyrroline-5-carboxylate reductase [Hyphomicrobium sulfonivorans]|uniref:Pyrroline-5-carboxylate reductase n=1 Tax=Hyphomicrobium sulfonivorans TaxID=121290 RepID=A0A109B901_HYPSL|nr:pyrroline-5-carboxylate reductase [Hyphomicrobium sulfonivorans]KWT64192.1 Pyrroline-5-carboxylate reductase [Hyphomicrobium sulfonivorans]
MSVAFNGPLLFAGAGKMGGAILKGLLARGLDPSTVVVQDPAPPQAVMDLLAEHAIKTVPDAAAVDVTPAVILVAVKPQIMDDVLPVLARLAGPQTLIVSIAAGRRIANFEQYFADAAVVRAMPNTPAAILRGTTVAVPNAKVSDAQRAVADAMLSAVGDVIWLDDEDLLDAVTAVSGSGPAYVFYLAECLARAGEAAGLDAALAQQLARATVSGAGALLDASDLSAADLRRNVTSPGGTTAAALEVLSAPGDGLQKLMTEAVAAATQRGRDLAK